MAFSGTLQSVNAPYTILHTNETYPMHTGVLHRGEPMWVISDTPIVFDHSKIVVVPTRITANKITFQCSLPMVQSVNNGRLQITVHNLTSTITANAMLEKVPSGRRVATLTVDNLTSSTEYRLYYTVRVHSSEELTVLKHIPLKTVRTSALEIEFLPPTALTITNGEYSFRVRSNHDSLPDLVSEVTVSPFGRFSNLKMLREASGDVFSVNGSLSELHHKTSVQFSVWANDCQYKDPSTRYKCLTCVEELVLEGKTGFEDIVCWSKTNYTQGVTCHTELYHEDVLIQSDESCNGFRQVYSGLNPNEVYDLRAWATDEFGQHSARSVLTLCTRAYEITHVKADFQHPEVLTFGSKPRHVRFVANATFERISVLFKTSDGTLVFNWNDVPFTRNDIFYEIDGNVLELTCEEVLHDVAGELELIIQGTPSSGTAHEISTKLLFDFDNDRSPPYGEVQLRTIACACTYASFGFTAYVNLKRVPNEYAFTIELESPSINYKPIDARSMQLHKRIDFQQLLPDTPYTTKVNVTTLSTRSTRDMHPTSFRTLVDPEFVVVHFLVDSTFPCTAIFEGTNRARVVIRLSSHQTHLVKRGCVVQLCIKPGRTVLLHTSKQNHYVVSMKDGVHKKVAKCVFYGVQYDEESHIVTEPLLSEQISY